MFKKHIFKNLLLTALAVLMLGTTACKKDEPKTDSGIKGIWISSGGDAYKIENSRIYHSWDASSPEWNDGRVGDIVKVLSESGEEISISSTASSGFIIYQLNSETSASSWDFAEIGKYTVSKWKNFLNTTVQLTDAYSGTENYWFNTADDAILNIITNASNEAVFFGVFGAYQKQN